MSKSAPQQNETSPKRVSPEILEELHMLSALSGKRLAPQSSTK